MNKRVYLIGFFSLLMLGIGLFRDFYIENWVDAEVYVHKIRNYIEQDKKEINSILSDTEFIEQILKKKEKKKASEEQIQKVATLNNKNYTIFFFNGDSLVHWTNNKISFLINEPLKKFPEKPITIVTKRDNGLYALYITKMVTNEANVIKVFAYIPIYYNYTIETKYLEHKFAFENFPKALQLKTKNDLQEATYKSYKLFEKNDHYYLTANGPLRTISFQYWQLLLYASWLILFAIFIDKIASHISSENHPALGSAILIVSFFGVKLFGNIIEFTTRFNDITIFQKTFLDFFLSQSLGDFFINIFLLLWVIIFFYRQYKAVNHNFIKLSQVLKYTLTFLNSFGIILVVIFITTIFEGLILDSQVVFNFDFLFTLDGYSFPSILGVISLMFGLFVFSQLMMETILKIGLNRKQRINTYAITMSTILPLLFILNLSPVEIFFFCISYLALFDYYVDNRSYNLQWIVTWMAVFSFFAACLLFSFNSKKDQIIRERIANQIIEDRDLLAEEDLKKFIGVVSKDAIIKSLIPEDTDTKINGKLLKKRISFLFFKYDYLYINYELNFYAFNKHLENYIQNQTLNYQQLNQKHAKIKGKQGENFTFFIDKNHWNYFNRSSIGSNTQNPLLLVFELKSFSRANAKVFTELLKSKPFRGVPELDKSSYKYNYAVYKNKKLQNTNSRIFPKEQSLKPAYIPKDGETLSFNGKTLSFNESSSYFTIKKHKTNGNIVVIEKSIETIFITVSLFSNIFAVLLVLAIVIVILNTFFNFIPKLTEFDVLGYSTLKNRIQVSVIGLIIISFFGIGYVTVNYFERQSSDYHKNRARRKTTTVTNSVLKDIRILHKNNPNFKLEDLDISEISKINRMDIILFDTEGKLIKSSNPEIYTKGILSKRMDAYAFYQLNKLGFRSTEGGTFETIGTMRFKASYNPIILNDKLIAYVELPYYSENLSGISDLKEFIGALINVYVFILLIAGGLAVFVARSITNPISKIGEKIKAFKLGGSHEPIEWHTKDEIGELVAEFNKMAIQIEASVEKLAKSEKEGAWREMAKQVAHEIKNPLTPMKLSIQYLLLIYKSQPELMESKLKEVCNTIIGQIENLASIASEFSNFAKMPEPSNRKFEISPLIKSVFNLFEQQQQERNIRFEFFSDNAIYQVYADKNHLLRVFNNLVKNAAEAIPFERIGIIQVSIYKEFDQVVIEVKDNGLGISESMKEKVFVPNFTTKSSGTGLGLAISKQIIESSNGSISFETIIDIGTKFFVKLPIIKNPIPKRFKF